MATLAPFNPNIEFATLIHLFLRGQPPLIVSARLLVARAKRGVTLFVNPPPWRYCSAHSTHYVCCRPSFFGTTTSCVRSIHTAPLYHGKSLIPLVIPFHPSLITLQALSPNYYPINQSCSASLRILQPSLLRTSLQYEPNKAPCVSFAQFHSLPHCIKHMPKPIPINKKMRHPC